MLLQWPSTGAVTIAMQIAPDTYPAVPLKSHTSLVFAAHLYNCSHDVSEVISLQGMFDVLIFQSELLIRTRTCQVACKPNMAKPYWVRNPT